MAQGLHTIIFKFVYWYMNQISGERLQDHWSSGLVVSVRIVITQYQQQSQTTNLIKSVLYSIAEKGILDCQNDDLEHKLNILDCQHMLFGNLQTVFWQ